MKIELPQIIFQLVIFSVVVGALKYMLFQPVLDVLEARRKRVIDGQKAADESLAEKDKLEETKKDIIMKAEKKASELVETARTNAKKSEKELLDQAKKDANDQIEKMIGDWQEEKKQHLQDMKNEFVSAVVATAEKVIEADLDPKKHQKLIDQELDSLIKMI